VVESQPSKLLVAGSIPVSRSRVERCVWNSVLGETVKFEQGTIKVEKEREFGDLKSAIEKAFAADRVTKYLKELDSRNIRVRDLNAIFAANTIDRAAGGKAGTVRSLYESLPVSDQAQVREFYLSKVEEVDPALRAKFHKLYQYY
jgi:hypothetical protein